MSTETDTAPAAEIENAELSRTSISDALGGETSHQRIDQVGEDEAAPAAAPAAPAASAPAAVKPETDAAPKPGEEDEFAGKHPAWMRKQIKAERARADAAEARARGGPQPERRAPTPEEAEEMNRPMSRAEIQAYHANERLRFRVETSEDAFVDKHGGDKFDEVREWLISKQVSPGNNPMESWALAQRNPWAAAYQQYQRELIANEIGDDPAAYRAKLEAEIRAGIAAEQEERPAAPPAPASMRGPPPAPASTARAAGPARDQGGRFTGPQPIGGLFKHKTG